MAIVLALKPGIPTLANPINIPFKIIIIYFITIPHLFSKLYQMIFKTKSNKYQLLLRKRGH